MKGNGMKVNLGMKGRLNQNKQEEAQLDKQVDLLGPRCGKITNPRCETKIHTA